MGEQPLLIPHDIPRQRARMRDTQRRLRRAKAVLRRCDKPDKLKWWKDEIKRLEALIKAEAWAVEE